MRGGPGDGSGGYVQWQGLHLQGNPNLAQGLFLVPGCYIRKRSRGLWGLSAVMQTGVRPGSHIARCSVGKRELLSGVLSEATPLRWALYCRERSTNDLPERERLLRMASSTEAPGRAVLREYVTQGPSQKLGLLPASLPTTNAVHKNSDRPNVTHHPQSQPLTPPLSHHPSHLLGASQTMHPFPPSLPHVQLQHLGHILVHQPPHWPLCL